MRKIFDSICIDIPEVEEYISKEGLSFVCNENMQVEASEEDFNKLIEKFPEIEYVEVEIK